jgi:hypothetical protein
MFDPHQVFCGIKCASFIASMKGVDEKAGEGGRRRRRKQFGRILRTRATSGKCNLTKLDGMAALRCSSKFIYFYQRNNNQACLELEFP